MSDQSNLLQVQAAPSKSRARFGGHSMFMMACCLAMIGGTGLVLASAPEGSSLADRLWLAAPMLGCVGLHLVMHRFMGRCAPAGKTQRGETND